jgi:uncharacterized protein (TIGR02001 family)
LVLTAVAAVALSGANAFAADLMAKKALPPPPPPSPWDIAFGAGIASDYNFRGISQSDRKPSVNAYFEPRYNFNPNLQAYVGIGGYSIDFPNRPSAEIDLYGGIRPTFGALSFDLGIWYYWYPGGQCFGPTIDCVAAALPNGNIIKKDVSFVEFFGKVNYAFNDAFTVGLGVYYDPDWLATGADGTYVSGTAKYTWASTPIAPAVGAYVSGELGHYSFGTTDVFYAAPPAFPFGTPLPDYTTWNIGLGLTWKVFTLDLRYYDTDLSKGECNVLTGDHTATFNAANVSAINPGGLGSKWCDATFIAKLSFDATLGALK